MGVGYILVNHSRAEVVTFCHLPTSKERELAGNPVSAAITTWYLLQHRGDQIAFVSDTEGDWPFQTGSASEISSYKDMTDDIVLQLIESSILRDDGIAWRCKYEPESNYIRSLKNVWMD